jgi:predicted TIM-barrel fold metal-dependent hydrolase
MIIDIHAHIFTEINGRNGQEYTKSGPLGMVLAGPRSFRFMPPQYGKTRFDKDMLLAAMDDANIDCAVLLQNPTIGERNSEISDAIDAGKERLAGVIMVDPFDCPNCGDILDKWKRPRMNTCKIEMSEGWGLSGIHPQGSLRSAGIRQLIKQVADRGMNLIIDTGPMKERGWDVDALKSLINEFSHVPIIIEHFCMPSPEVINNEKEHDKWLRMLCLAEKPNVSIGLSALPEVLDDYYPCKASILLIQEGLKRFGAEKFIWGSDIPGTMKRMTYRQTLDYLFLADLSESVIQKLVCENALGFFPVFSNYQNFSSKGGFH